MKKINKTKEELLRELESIRKENDSLKASYEKDITDRKNNEEALEKEHSLLRTLIDYLPSAVFIKDEKFRNVIVNAIHSENVAQHLIQLGLPPNYDILGKTDFEVYPKELAEIYLSEDRKVIVEGLSILNKEISVMDPKRELRWFLISKIPLKDKNGAIKGMVGISHDITNQKQAMEEIVLAKEKAEISDRLKSEFLAQISHEIRTPLHAILNFSSILKEEIEDNKGSIADINKFFDGIKVSCKRITRTIDLILNMSEIQTGAYHYQPIMFNIYDKVLKVVHYNLNQNAIDAGLNFLLEKETDETIIYADEYSIYQIIYLIAENAIKFTKEGSVFIRISRNKSNQLSVIIEDTGIGISEEYLSNIFTPFLQEEHGYSRRFEGNGLGLALVKKYCDLNNINIEIKSKKGIGSTFSLTFQ